MQLKVDEKKIKVKQEKEYNESMEQSEFRALVKKLKISEEEALKNTIKLQDSLEELGNCKKCSGIHECKNKVRGHVYFPEANESKLVFSYIPCKYKKWETNALKEKETKDNVLKQARIKDIKITKNRSEIIKAIKEFYDKFDISHSSKGIYLHGSFGTGKTFIIAALFNELENKYHVNTEMVYFPELLRMLKENLNLVNERLNYLEKVDLLLIDDIGAEKVTEWGRDEILGTILQSRMNNGMPTFFTSNLTISELEKILSITKDSEDSLKAKRIIERIKCLTVDIELIGKNYREQ